MTTHDDCTHAKTASARAACRRQRSGEAAKPRTEADARADHPTAAKKRRGLRVGEETTAERRVREAFAKDGAPVPVNAPGRPDCDHSQVVRQYYDALRDVEGSDKQVRTRVARYLCQGEACGKLSHVPFGSILSMTRLREDNGTGPTS